MHVAPSAVLIEGNSCDLTNIKARRRQQIMAVDSIEKVHRFNSLCGYNHIHVPLKPKGTSRGAEGMY